jgi:hypothetical protein
MNRGGNDMWKNGLLSGAIVLAGGLLASMAVANPETGYEKSAGTEAAEQHDMDKSHQSLSFSEIDSNADGYISESELTQAQAQAELSVEHDELDTNNDGRVDQTEFAAFEQTGELEETDPGALEPESTEEAPQ